MASPALASESFGPATIEVGTGTFDWVAGDDDFLLDLPTAPRVFADEAALIDFLRTELGFETRANDADLPELGVTITEAGMPLFLDATDPLQPRLFEVHNSTLALLGGSSGRIVLSGEEVCVDIDGDCAGPYADYLVPVEGPEYEDKQPVIVRTTPHYSMVGESYRFHFPTLLYFIAEAGSKTVLRFPDHARTTFYVLINGAVVNGSRPAGADCRPRMTWSGPDWSAEVGLCVQRVAARVAGVSNVLIESSRGPPMNHPGVNLPSTRSPHQVVVKTAGLMFFSTDFYEWHVNRVSAAHIGDVPAFPGSRRDGLTQWPR